jgi:hypothetical protein
MIAENMPGTDAGRLARMRIRGKCNQRRMMTRVSSG